MKGVKTLKNKISDIERLYMERSNIIYKYLLKIGCLDEDARDIVQDTFSKAIENLIHLNEKNISAWLFKVSLNKYYDLCRKQKRYPVIVIDENIITNLIEDDSETLLIKKENKLEVEEILEALSPIHKNLIVMKYDLGLSYIQIANMLDMKEETVKTYLYRARNDFKRRWVMKYER